MSTAKLESPTAILRARVEEHCNRLAALFDRMADWLHSNAAYEMRGAGADDLEWRDLAAKYRVRATVLREVARCAHYYVTVRNWKEELAPFFLGHIDMVAMEKMSLAEASTIFQCSGLARMDEMIRAICNDDDGPEVPDATQ